MAFKFNPLSGQLDFYKPVPEADTFSNSAFYDVIPAATSVVVPEDKFMLMSGRLDIEGDLEINGKLVEV